MTTNCMLVVQRWRRMTTSYDKNGEMTKDRGNIWAHFCFKQAMPNNKLGCACLSTA
jgi:hypothetical protein